MKSSEVIKMIRDSMSIVGDVDFVVNVNGKQYCFEDIYIEENDSFGGECIEGVLDGNI